MSLKGKLTRTYNYSRSKIEKRKDWNNRLRNLNFRFNRKKSKRRCSRNSSRRNKRN